MFIERSISSKGASVRLQCLTKRACLSRGAFNREEQLFACHACRQAHAYGEKHLSVYFALVCFARSMKNIWRGPGSDDADYVEPCFCWMMQASRVAKQVACPRRCQLRIARVEASSIFLFLQPGVAVSNNSLLILTEDKVIVEFLAAQQIKSVAILLPFGISTNATT